MSDAPAVYVGDDGRLRMRGTRETEVWVFHPDTDSRRPERLDLANESQCGCWWRKEAYYNGLDKPPRYAYETFGLSCVHQPAPLPDWVTPEIGEGGRYVPDATLSLYAVEARGGGRLGERYIVAVPVASVAAADAALGHTPRQPMNEEDHHLHHNLVLCGRWAQVDQRAQQVEARLQYPTRSSDWRKLDRKKAAYREQLGEFKVTDAQLRELAKEIRALEDPAQQISTIVNWYRNLDQPRETGAPGEELAALMGW